jgi:CRISPR-associated protein Cas1
MPSLPDLVPARMLNEHAYCPRLAYLEWVQGDFADNSDTVDGRFAHRVVNTETGAMPDPPDPDEAMPETLHARSVMLSAPALGLIARMDLIEAEGTGTSVTPVDYKRGRAPEIPEGAWEPERVQLCAQAFVLEENGYRVERGVLYFVTSKQRVTIEIDEPLRQRTRELLADLRASAERPQPPPPLRDSPKCPRCSLVGICLPDELNLLRGGPPPDEGEAEDGAFVPVSRVRRLVPSRDDALPLYVHTGGTRVGKTGAELVVEPREGEKQVVRMSHTSHLAVFGAVQVSTQALHALCERGISVAYLSAGGWLQAITRGMDHKNVELRQRQFAAAADPEKCLAIARRLVAVKLRNCRTLIRRNAEEPPPHVLARLRELVAAVEAAPSLESLLGLEGTAARLYFQAYAGLLQPPAGEGGGEGERAAHTFDFEGRNRRPPRDPINAMLSMGYSLLTKDLVISAMAVGLDPYLGFYHQPRYGRPALALDVMEEFRPLIVDSLVLSAVNTGSIRASDFLRRGGACAFTQPGRTKFLRAYERRMDEEITHPVFAYRISYRRTLEVQLRLLARTLAGEIAEYPPFATR